VVAVEEKNDLYMKAEEKQFAYMAEERKIDHV
jgi:hypothetical protein